MEWHPLFSGIFGGLVAACLGTWALRSLKPARVDSDGWRRLHAGLMIHVSCVGSAAAATFMGWMFLFVGSARSDAAVQEGIMLILAIGFTVCAAFIWWTCYALNISWKATCLRTSRLSHSRKFDLRALAVVEFVNWRHQYLLEFTNGDQIYVSPYMHGSEDLFDHLDECDFADN